MLPNSVCDGTTAGFVSSINGPNELLRVSSDSVNGRYARCYNNFPSLCTRSLFSNDL